MVSVGFRVLGLHVVGLEFQGFRVCFVFFFLALHRDLSIREWIAGTSRFCNEHVWLVVDLPL